MNYIPAQEIKDFFTQLNSSGIDYVLIKNIADELPNQLQDGKDIDILVKENQIKEFEKFMRSHNYKKRIHPYGKKVGWNFVYKLPESQFWKLNNNQFTLYIDVCFKLCCKSLMPKVWIPLDNYINENIWINKIFDEENNWWIMDNESQIVYLITRSVFDKKEFNSKYITEIEQRKNLLKNESVKLKLSKIFFKYTDSLIAQIENNNYDQIVNNYLTFKEY